MKLRTRARYALRAMIQIARSPRTDEPVNLNEIAEKTSVSRRYLEQLVIPLKNASLIKGVSGKGGGYLLSKPADEIKIGDIIEAAIGPINIVECVNDPDSCMKVEWCECRPVYTLLNNKIVEALNEFTLAELSGCKTEMVISEERNTADSEQIAPPQTKIRVMKKGGA